MGLGSSARRRAFATSSGVWRSSGEQAGKLQRSGEPDHEDTRWLSTVLQRANRGGRKITADRGGGSDPECGGQRMFGSADGSSGSAGRRETGTGASGRGVSLGRKLSETGGEEDHGLRSAGARRQERQYNLPSAENPHTQVMEERLKSEEGQRWYRRRKA